MARSFDFAIIKLAPDPVRDETLNGAVVIFRPDRLEVCVTPNPERLRAIIPSLQTQGLDELSASLQTIDVPNLSTAERIQRLRRVPGISVSEPGTLYGETEDDLIAHVGELIARMLSAVRSSGRSVMPMKVTRLTNELTKVFRKERLLGRGDEAINQHKIVRNVAVSSDGRLRADFAAKNRKMHITETVDLRSEGEVSTARLKDIAVAAVTLDEAKRTFGRTTQRYFIYAGGTSAERQAQGFLQAVEHHADYVFNYASRNDRAKYLDFIFDALRGDIAGSARISGASKPRGKKAPRQEGRRLAARRGR
jgi:Protein of unknown function (DUF3037)